MKNLFLNITSMFVIFIMLQSCVPNSSNPINQNKNKKVRSSIVTVDNVNGRISTIETKTNYYYNIDGTLNSYSVWESNTEGFYNLVDSFRVNYSDAIIQIEDMISNNSTYYTYDLNTKFVKTIVSEENIGKQFFYNSSGFLTKITGIIQGVDTINICSNIVYNTDSTIASYRFYETTLFSLTYSNDTTFFPKEFSTTMFEENNDDISKVKLLGLKIGNMNNKLISTFRDQVNFVDFRFDYTIDSQNRIKKKVTYWKGTIAEIKNYTY